MTFTLFTCRVLKSLLKTLEAISKPALPDKGLGISDPALSQRDLQQAELAQCVQSSKYSMYFPPMAGLSASLHRACHDGFGRGRWTR